MTPRHQIYKLQAELFVWRILFGVLLGINILSVLAGIALIYGV